MYVAALWPAVLGALVAFAHAKPTRTVSLSRRAPASDAFVSIEGTNFVVNGAPLRYVGTNAYWLHTLSEEDIDKTLTDIAAAGIKVVRTWAFNSVREVPTEGTWFQLIQNGNITVNEGPDGLQKLDKVVELAEKHGIYLILSLTNNWNPDGVTTGADNQTLARNSLSNDYGGMDTYIRGFDLPTHDLFYTNETLVSAFKDYASCIVKRYANRTAVFSWELANDPRCNSTIPAGGCNPQDITRWHADISETVRSLDTNHLISSGSGGFYCVDCPKVFPLLPPAPPPPGPSAAPGTSGSRRRSTRRQFLTRAKVLRDRLEARKKTRNAKRNVGGGGGIRGRWAPTATRRQEDFNSVGPAFDGSFGVDSEDILNSPNMDFGSLQYFPDQNNYAPTDPTLSAFDNIVQQGNSWIQQHADTAQSFGKPVTLDAFGLVTQSNAPNFVPFNAASAPYGPDGSSAFVTNEQQAQAYGSWIDTGLSGGLAGAVQYQWGQSNLTPGGGTPVVTPTGSTGIDTPVGTTGFSPNDGYSINGVGRQEVVDVIQEANQRYG